MSKRVDIKTGFRCNNNCVFCVQANNKPEGNRSKEAIFCDLRAAKKTGCSEVVFTGGEVSLRPDFLELLSYAKGLGFDRIQVQTNARMFYYRDFCEKAIGAGLTEFAPAIHGHTAELHDSLTRCNGSFVQTCQGIKNMREQGIDVLTNTVVVKPNYTYIPEIAKLLVKLRVNQFQFAFVHPMGAAETNFEAMVPEISLAAPFIHKGLQIGIDAGIRVMAEAMPFCLMKGYERYVSELYIPPTEVRTLNNYDPDFSKTRKESGKTLFPQCKECRYALVCEGCWREYSDKKGSNEFKPVMGTKIKNAQEILLKR